MIITLLSKTVSAGPTMKTNGRQMVENWKQHETQWDYVNPIDNAAEKTFLCSTPIGGNSSQVETQAFFLVEARCSWSVRQASTDESLTTSDVAAQALAKC